MSKQEAKPSTNSDEIENFYLSMIFSIWLLAHEFVKYQTLPAANDVPLSASVLARLLQVMGGAGGVGRKLGVRVG